MKTLWKHGCFMLIFALGFWATSPLAAQTKERGQIPDEYKWNLADIYPSVEAWQQDKASFAARFEKIAGFKRTLQKSGSSLYEALQAIDEVSKDFERLWIYAAMLSDQDTREAGPLAMASEIGRMSTVFGSSLAYLEPEILAIPQDKLDRFFKEEPRLSVHRQAIDNIQRMKAHTLSEAEEKIISKAGLMAGIAEGAHNVFSNADMPYQNVRFSDGHDVPVAVSAYEKYRYSPMREDRIQACKAFFGSLGKFRRTYGSLLEGKIKENLFYKDVRKYDSILESHLFRRSIPTTVYTNLIKNVHDSLPLLHRYLKIRKRMLGVDELHYYDFYPDLVKGVDISFKYQDAQNIIKRALGVLGDEYGKKLAEAFRDRWVDVYPSTGKASGAYSNAAYETHPYVKVNYNDRFADMSMLAHELGHAMHSYFSNKNQPYPLANYSNFVAEVASTTNECLLVDHVIQTTSDPLKKLSLLGNWVESFRQTLFRQTLFAEFELMINRIAEQGEPLSGERFSQIYLDLIKKYYGHNEGVSVIDDFVGDEWGYISHFFLGFYNYQYSTSYMAALALAEKMRTGGKEMVGQYIEFLSSGGSDYPIPLLKKLGLDMTSDEPCRLAMATMSRALDEMERLLDARELKK